MTSRTDDDAVERAFLALLKPGRRLLRRERVTLSAIARGLALAPRAIDLAATEARVLGLAAVHARLGDDDAPWASEMDRALDGVDPRARRVLGDLTVFSEWFDGDAARVVIGRESLHSLIALVDRDLLETREGPDRSRQFSIPVALRAALLRNEGASENARQRLVTHAVAMGANCYELGIEVVAPLDLDRMRSARRILEDAFDVLESPRRGAAGALRSGRVDSRSAATIAMTIAAAVLRGSGLSAGRRMIERALAMTKKQRGDREIEGRLRVADARLLLAAGDFLESDHAYLAARKIVSRSDRATLASIGHGRSLVLRRLRKFEEAETEARLALRLWTELGIEKLAIQSRGSLGAIAMERGDLESAEMYFRDVVVLAGRHREPFARAHGRASAGHVQQERGDLPAALKSFELARSAFQRLGDARQDAVFQFYVGATHHEAGDLTRAAPLYRSAARTLHTLKAGALEAVARAGLGALHAERGDRTRASDELSRAQELAAQSGDPAVQLVVDLRARSLAIHDARIARQENKKGFSTWSEPSLETLASDPLWTTSDDARTAGRTLIRFARAASRAAREEEPGFTASETEPAIVRVGTRTIDLSRRPLLFRLASVMAARPDVVWTTSSLAAAVWVGERMLAQAAAHRVRVAISELRGMGLREVIVRSPAGYRWKATALAARSPHSHV